MKKLVVLGGAFNPPLNSHFSLAEQILNEIEDVEKVLFMPVNSNYKKSEKLVENEHRYNMLKLICDLNPNFEISRLELDSDRVLTTIETLRILRKEYSNNEIIFATGTDNLKEFETWNNCQDILDGFKLLIFERGGDIFEDIVNNSDFLKQNKNSLMKLENNIRTNLSSTFAREKLRNGKSIRYLTPDSVIDYIKENNLY